MVRESGQAGDEKCDEVKVTPEMIRAGSEKVWELRGFDPNFVAESVFLAMLGVIRPSNPDFLEVHAHGASLSL